MELRARIQEHLRQRQGQCEFRRVPFAVGRRAARQQPHVRFQRDFERWRRAREGNRGRAPDAADRSLAFQPVRFPQRQ